MFGLLNELNQLLLEFEERKNPVIKALLVDLNTSETKILDLQHLPKKELVQDTIKIISQIISQIGPIESIEAITNEDGLFNKLLLKFKLKNKDKIITIEIDKLSSKELENIKKAAYIKFKPN